MDLRLAKLAVDLFGIDDAIVKDVGGQAEDILLLYSDLRQLGDLRQKFAAASVCLSYNERHQMDEGWKNSFHELTTMATDTRKICCRSSIEPSGIQAYDNVERQEQLTKSLNSIRETFQLHIKRLQKVIYSSESRAMPSLK
jgi:hypothetical protein